MELFYTALLLSPLLILLTLKLANLKLCRKEGAREAPGPWNLPILGSLHVLVGKKHPHIALRDLSNIYGPIMSLKLGAINNIIISSPEATREIMKTNDIAFASRPVTDAVAAVFYGDKDISFSPYGEYWRQMRRLCSQELLSTKRVLSFRAVREEEVSQLIQCIAASSASGAAVNLSSMMADTSNNIIARAVMGGRMQDQQILLSAIRDATKLLSGFNAAELFPFMPFIDRITGFRTKQEQCHKKLDHVAENIIQEHKKNRSHRFSNKDDEQLMDGNLTDVLLRIQHEDSLQFSLSNDNIKAVIIDMIASGSETSFVVLEWAMSEMIQNPSIMEKAQQEVRKVINNINDLGNLANEGLISGRLPYLQFVINETLRLHPPTPLLLPRENQESVEIMGYMIPPKTRVMINVWAIGRNEKYWDDPEKFRPERFEETHINFKGAHFEYVPFGSGRRICPGIHFSLDSMEIILAYLLYYFDWKFVGKKGEKLDMREDFGVSVNRKTPLYLVPTLRFPIH